MKKIQYKYNPKQMIKAGKLVEDLINVVRTPKGRKYRGNNFAIRVRVLNATRLIVEVFQVEEKQLDGMNRVVVKQEWQRGIFWFNPNHDTAHPTLEQDEHREIIFNPKLVVPINIHIPVPKAIHNHLKQLIIFGGYRWKKKPKQ